MYFLLIIVAFGSISTSFLTKTSKPEPFSRSKRVVNGKKSSIEDFPYIVALEKDFEQFCGGAIISRHHILTAAHCFKPNSDPWSFKIRAASSFLEQGGSVHQVFNFSTHENFTGDNNDLAIVQLEEPIDFGDTKKSIEFGIIRSEPGSAAVTAGWGSLKFNGTAPNQLNSIRLSVVDKKSCEVFWKTQGYEIQEGQICATDLTGSNQSVCNGDSGGPLIVDGKLSGITSYADDCRSWPHGPNVFTDVAYYRKWIDKKMMELSPYRKKNTALHWGAKHGDENIVKLVAGTCKDWIKDINETTGYTPLHIAMQFNHENIYTLLVKVYGANQDIRDYSGKKARQYSRSQKAAVSQDTIRKIKARKKHTEKDLGFLRIGSLNVRVKRTTEAFSQFLGVATNTTSSTGEKIHKSWGSADNLPDKMMPPPKYAPIKKRRSRRATDFVPKTSSQPCSPMSLKTSSRRPASISSLATNSLPPPSHRYRHHQQNDSDSDGACGFDAAWRGGN